MADCSRATLVLPFLLGVDVKRVILALAALAASALLATQGWIYAAVLALQLAGLAMAALSIATGGRFRPLRVLHYYLLVTLATVIALVGYLRRGVPATWDKAAGSRL